MEPQLSTLSISDAGQHPITHPQIGGVVLPFLQKADIANVRQVSSAWKDSCDYHLSELAFEVLSGIVQDPRAQEWECLSCGKIEPNGLSDLLSFGTVVSRNDELDAATRLTDVVEATYDAVLKNIPTKLNGMVVESSSPLKFCSLNGTGITFAVNPDDRNSWETDDDDDDDSEDEDIRKAKAEKQNMKVADDTRGSLKGTVLLLAARSSLPTSLKNDPDHPYHGVVHLHIVGIDSMTTINDSFFSYSNALKTVTVESMPNLTTIGNRFLDQSGVTKVTMRGLPKLTSIGHRFLELCRDLTVLSYDATFRPLKVGDWFMLKCYSIETLDLTFLENATTLGQGFLYRLYSVKKLDLSPMMSLTDVGSDFVNDCVKLESCVVGSFGTVTTLPQESFYNLHALQELDFGHSPTKLFSFGSGVCSKTPLLRRIIASPGLDQIQLAPARFAPSSSYPYNDDDYEAYQPNDPAFPYPNAFAYAIAKANQRDVHTVKPKTPPGRE